MDTTDMLSICVARVLLTSTRCCGSADKQAHPTPPAEGVQNLDAVGERSTARKISMVVHV